MTVKEGAEVLRRYNQWRREGEGKMQDIREIGIAIDIMLAFYNGTQTPVEIYPALSDEEILKMNLDEYERLYTLEE